MTRLGNAPPGRAMWLPLIAATVSVAVGWSAERPVGFAVSEAVFLIEGAEVFGNVTLLAGETVTSSYLPLRLRLQSGTSLTLGPGSQARIWSDRVRLDGVSLDVAVGRGAPFLVEVGAFTLELEPGGRGSIFSDRPELVSAWTEQGSLRAMASGSEQAQAPAGRPLTLVAHDGAVRLQDERAALESARIQVRQIRHLRAMAAVRPAIASRADSLLQQIAAAAGGLSAVQPVEEAGMRDALPAVDTGELLAAVRRVQQRLLGEAWALAGCGSPECVSREPVHRPHDFQGWIGGMPAPALPLAVPKGRGGRGRVSPPQLRWFVPLLSLTLGLLLAELLLRVAAPYAPQVELDIYGRDAAENLRLLPNLDKRHVSRHWDVDIRTNADGWRDAAEDADAPILGLGDSFAFGWGVEEEEGLYRRLEAELGQRILNAAVPGTGPSDQARMLETALAAAHPSLTLAAVFVGNDFVDVRLGGAGRFDVAGGLLRQPGAAQAGGLRTLALESRLLQLLRALQFRFGTGAAGAAPRNWDDWMRAFAEVHRHDAAPELFEGMSAALDRIHAWCEERESELALIVIPRSWQIDDAELAETLTGLAMDRAELDLDRPQRALLDWGRERSVLVIDLLPAFRAAAARTPELRLYHTPDSHWTAEGHALAARVAAAQLTAVQPRR